MIVRFANLWEIDGESIRTDEKLPDNVLREFARENERSNNVYFEDEVFNRFIQNRNNLEIYLFALKHSINSINV